MPSSPGSQSMAAEALSLPTTTPLRNVVLFSGNVLRPSKSRALASRIGERLAAVGNVNLTPLDLYDAGRALGAAYARSELSAQAEHVVSSLENADALVVVTPIHNGSYPGLFKHLIDFIDRDALAGKPVLLGASGGGQRHAMMIGHQLVPLFGFFAAQISAYPVFEPDPALETAPDEIDQMASRIDRAVRQFALMLGP